MTLTLWGWTVASGKEKELIHLDLQFLWKTRLCRSFAGSSSRIFTNSLFSVPLCTTLSYWQIYSHKWHWKFVHVIQQEQPDGQKTLTYNTFYSHFLWYKIQPTYTAGKSLQQFWRKKWGCWCRKDGAVLLRGTAGLWREMDPYIRHLGSQEALLGLQLGCQQWAPSVKTWWLWRVLTLCVRPWCSSSYRQTCGSGQLAVWVEAASSLLSPHTAAAVWLAGHALIGNFGASGWF